MSLESSLTAYLKTKLGSTPISPDLSRKTVSDYITYQIIDDIKIRHMTAGSGICHKRVQFDIYASKKSTIVSLYETLRTNLDNYRGTMSGLAVGASFLETSRDGLVEPKDGSADVRYRRSIDFIIWHSESVPSY